jgi:hypothetical protein
MWVYANEKYNSGMEYIQETQVLGNDGNVVHTYVPYTGIHMFFNADERGNMRDKDGNIVRAEASVMIKATDLTGTLIPHVQTTFIKKDDRYFRCVGLIDHSQYPWFNTYYLFLKGDELA